ncbi:hypothetical protein F444_00877 [Phytophthora nicotianae P1976]|uniref:HECT-type E3 ubiquitin transferase n=1 Tax=Phytophthora nicotianae P1976 TaxID=1317066 RepID=A0A081B2I7_PHYNI|nr:hypothetical protein F444_00877 [Phytophthora nicotianae P1976]
MEAVLGFLVVLAIIALLFFFLSMLARCAYIRRQRSLELHAPLLNSDDRRLDAALRDAEQGFNECTVCSFENFKRFKFCTVCGEAIVSDEQDGDRDMNISKKRSTRLSFLPLLKRETKVELVTVTPPKQTTRRRLRAQRRKEWTRKIDVAGCAFWFRDGRWGDTQFTGFVVKFQSTPAMAGNGMEKLLPNAVGEGESSLPPSECGTDVVTVASSVKMDTPDPNPVSAEVNTESVEQDSTQQPLVGSIDGCIATLIRGTQEQHVVLTPSTDTTVDASKLPLGNSTSTEDNASTPLTEIMALAAKDFPSKYAHFVTATSALLIPAEKEHLRLNVERANVFEDSMESLAIIPLQNVHSVLRINFLDESGVDAGGLHREWFVLLNEMLVDPARGLFVCTNENEQTYFLNPCFTANSLPDQLLHLYATGRLLGRALLEGSMLCFHLAPPLLKLMLGYPLSFADVEDLDPEVYTNLRWLLDNENVESIGLYFTVTVKEEEKYRDVELVPGGSSIAVTDSNKREYVERKWQYLLVESVAPQLQVFLCGLYEIVPRELLLLFDPEEFDFLLCGSDEIDVDDWERNTKYSEELHHHRSLIWFWELVREMPNEYRRRLLQFSTGSSRVPLGGFSALTSYDGRLCPFTLKAVSLVGDGFIHSHACFNRLDLPLHVVRDELKAVLYATLETEVYGFTTD